MAKAHANVEEDATSFGDRVASIGAVFLCQEHSVGV